MSVLNVKQITDQSIFGEYKKAEDRVTAALLHVINAGGQMVVERLFSDYFDIPSNNINVIPQSYHKDSIPDGELSCDCKYNIFIESKIISNAINEEQLKNHISLTNTAQNRYLIYITPDKTHPEILQNFMVEWMDWHTVVNRLLGIIADELAGELLTFLINQFVLLVDHLVYSEKKPREVLKDIDYDPDFGKDERVIIVGGRWGEDVALNYGFYACQPNRYFKPARYIAFYHQNRIKYLFEIEGNPIESVDLRSIPHISSSTYFTDKDSHYAGNPCKYFKLKQIQTFESEITNDKVDKNGNPCAYIQGQAYTTYEKITNSIKTSQL